MSLNNLVCFTALGVSPLAVKANRCQKFNVPAFDDSKHTTSHQSRGCQFRYKISYKLILGLHGHRPTHETNSCMTFFSFLNPSLQSSQTRKHSKLGFISSSIPLRFKVSLNLWFLSIAFKNWEIRFFAVCAWGHHVQGACPESFFWSFHC